MNQFKKKKRELEDWEINDDYNDEEINEEEQTEW